MARTQKYTDDLLLEAVVRYAETTKDRIVAVELADWCRRNIAGLEEVRDYHFLRPVKEKDKKTGKITESKKRCTEKIEEINHARSITEKVKSNVLLFSSSTKDFFLLPPHIQQSQAEEAKAIFDEIRVKYERAIRENDVLRKTNNSLSEKVKIFEEQFPQIEKGLVKQKKVLNRIRRDWADERMKEVLENMGIEDDKIDLEQLANSIQTEMDEISDINRTLRQYYGQTDEDLSTWSLSAEVMKGL